MRPRGREIRRCAWRGIARGGGFQRVEKFGDLQKTVGRHASLLKPLRTNQRVHKITEKEQRDRAA